jgi:hypothetical protein
MRKDSLFNKCYWEKWLSACRKLIHVYHPVLVSTQNGSKTIISDLNSEVSIRKSREYFGSNKYRQELPQ